MKTFANIISYVFHPLLMATYGCLLVFFGLTDTIYAVFTPLRVKLLITATVFAFTFLLPLLNLLILYKLGYISSLKIEDRRERTFPMLMTALCYIGLFYMIYDFNIWPAIKIFVLGAGVCIALGAVISTRWQISAHAIGVGGLLGAMLAISYFVQVPMFMVLSAIILLSGIIGFSRLALQAHTPSQVYAGFIMGCVVQFMLFFAAQIVTFV
ncbi:MAG: PA-phosphatase [Bacteroidetes bacterium]|nr:PA-phosphatase [Bacteroidota bacterium]